MLADAIARSVRLDEPPGVVCAGRTDAGVHAWGQTAHVDLPAGYEGDLARALNRQTAPDLVVRDAAPAPDGFDARRSALWRHYRYLVLDAPVPDPLLARVSWHVSAPLDLRAMAASTDPLLGEHDFRALCRRPPGTSPGDAIVRRVTAAGWRRVDAEGLGGPPSSDLLRFDIVATSFCHQMVRSVVALLVDAGRGRANAATVKALLESASRAGAPEPAPPHGLCLVGVGYEVHQGDGAHEPGEPHEADGPDEPHEADEPHKADGPDEPHEADGPHRADEVHAGGGLPGTTPSR